MPSPIAMTLVALTWITGLLCGTYLFTCGHPFAAVFVTILALCARVKNETNEVE